MDNPDDRIDLLLAAADDGRPVLEDGLSGDAAQRGKKPKEADAGHWWREDDDPNDLAVQRWGVVAVEGREGDRQIKAIQALIDLRAQEQGAPVRIDRVPAGQSSKEAAAWKDDTYLSGDVKEEERPRYLLVLGDLHETSADLQHVLAVDTFVGRIHFGDASGETDEPGYAAYAQKVVDYALTGTRASSPDLLFYVAEDGSAATITGRSRLVEPSVEASQGNGDAASVRTLEANTVGALLAAGAGERPSVLLSVSHGLGAPKSGWRKGDEQWRRQGAMVVRPNEILDAERIRGQAFLPGGMWFLLACFGGGTPEKSAYRDWLLDLAAAKAFGNVGAVLDSLAPQQPFVAAMPQAALANPLGPLAVIGHLDLAWTYGFSATTTNESRSARILEPLKVMVRGSRAGVALGKLMRPYLETNDQLMSIYERQKNARVESRPDPTDPVERARLWMLRNDLRGYVLLGDPAARLPLRKNALKAEDPPRVPELRSVPLEIKATAGAPASLVAEVLRGDEAPRVIADRHGVPLDALWKQVAAVLAMDGGGEAPRAIAERAGVPLDMLWAWVDAYRAERRQRP